VSDQSRAGYVDRSNKVRLNSIGEERDPPHRYVTRGKKRKKEKEKGKRKGKKGKRKKEKGKRKEERGKRKEERGKRKKRNLEEEAEEEEEINAKRIGCPSTPRKKRKAV